MNDDLKITTYVEHYRAGRGIVAALLAIIAMVCLLVGLTGGVSAEAEEKHLCWEYDAATQKYYWYENGERQGVYGDPLNIWDSRYGLERGREIYDPGSDRWYWLDACWGGAKAVNKEVWIPYIYQSDLEKGENPDGKWVLYTKNGGMVKGFAVTKRPYWNLDGTEVSGYRLYYYDETTGAMAKGWRHFYDNHGAEPVDIWIYFDPITGVCLLDAETLRLLMLLDPAEWSCYSIDTAMDIKLYWLENLYEELAEDGNEREAD